MQSIKPKRIGGLFGRNTSPWLPEQTLTLVCLHDFHHKNFRQIGEVLGLTRAGVAKQYERWSSWAKKQPEYGPTYVNARRLRRKF